MPASCPSPLTVDGRAEPKGGRDSSPETCRSSVCRGKIFEATVKGGLWPGRAPRHRARKRSMRPTPAVLHDGSRFNYWVAGIGQFQSSERPRNCHVNDRCRGYSGQLQTPSALMAEPRAVVAEHRLLATRVPVEVHRATVRTCVSGGRASVSHRLEAVYLHALAQTRAPAREWPHALPARGASSRRRHSAVRRSASETGNACPWG